MKPLVYIAGPYTKPDPIENTHKAIVIAGRIYECGAVPIIPHLTMLWHLVDPRPLEFWYAYDLEILARCDAVFRIPGESYGADAEVVEADRLGIPVLFSIDSLEDWLETRETE